MINPDLFGYASAGLSIIMFLPQVIRTVKTKQTRDLSITSLAIIFTAAVLGTIYGIATQATPVIVANVAIGLSNLILLIVKLTNPEKRDNLFRI